MYSSVGTATSADGGLRDLSVLVTGGDGFIGRHLVRALLAAGVADVRVLDTSVDAWAERDAVRTIQGDVRDADALGAAMAGADVVFHEAAVVSVERSVEDPERSHSVNVDATLSLLQRAREEGARVVFASSAAIYGSPTTVPVAEDAPKDPVSPYGLEKLTSDHYCRLYAALYDVETVALRYFNVYGPGTSEYSGVIDTFLEQARSGGPITVQGDGEQTRDFVHVADVVQANLRAATTDHTGRAFNVGTGDAVRIVDLAETVRDVVDPVVDVVHTPPREGDVERSRADVSAARDLLGYEPQVELADGLRRLVDGNGRRASGGVSDRGR